ncbi:MAG TPA: FecR domain-containing protein [Rhizomicrobium sp.]|nr:FecR domain-containing protein [Rhizomicrobium sp.]
MSEARETHPMSAKEIKVLAAQWLERRERSDWSEKDRAELDAWLAQSTAHEVAYVRLESAWARTERLVVLRPLAGEQISHEHTGRRFFTPVLIRAAAAFALIAVLGMGAAYFLLQPRDRSYSTPVGGRETIAFADGTRIELNTNTALRARMNTDQRIVWLDRGEAFFRVKHDATHPFIVMIGTHRVTDIGTQFAVARDSKNVRVSVTEGRVTFDAPGVASQAALLKQGDVAIASAQSMSVTRKSTQALSEELGWRRGLIVFRHTTLADAAAELNRYNRVKLIVTDPVAAQRTIGATFRTSDVELFARVAEVALGLHVTDRGNEIEISR